MDCIVHEVTKSWTQMSDFHFTFKNKLGLFLTIIQQSKHNYVRLQMGKTDAQKGQVVSPNI